MKPITVKKLIEELKKYDENALVGLSKDSEGNDFSLISNTECISEGFMKNELGYNEYHETRCGAENLKPAIVLWPSN